MCEETPCGANLKAPKKELSEPCTLCIALDRTEAAPGHELEDCFANPESKHVKPRTCTMRMAQLRQLKSEGKSLPTEVAKLLTLALPKLPQAIPTPPTPTEQVPPKVTAMQMQAAFEDFVALLEQDPDGSLLQCYREAAEANGIYISPDPTLYTQINTQAFMQGTRAVPDYAPVLAFRSFDSLPDMQAAT